ncbi:hypothetical protein Clacol_000742 [Clathrus columnatus]|uniref:Vacuolar protein sorting-associated protein 33A n=1 Tax=Clathrus columnatus TaxID=1419009 RepID=A0AAV5A3S5_9AGAM|nr:hypothetical protein Clacol_000742 [Clathrus columnatus]
MSEILLPLTKTEVFNKSLEVQQNLLSSYDISAQLSAIEDLVARDAPENIVLRLLCLASLTSSGIKPKVLENIKREILQSYGYDRVALLINLASSSLLLPSPLPSKAAKFSYTQLRKQLRLVVEDQDYTPNVAADANQEEVARAEDRDISYTYSGYAPLSCRLVQCVAQKTGVLAFPGTKTTEGDDIRAHAHPIIGWKGFEDVISLIQGETVDIILQGEQSSFSAPLTKTDTMTTVVFFLGGCTYTEIAALRWMSRQTRGRKFLIATTGIINGNTLVNAFK